MEFELEQDDVPSLTTTRVKEHLEQGRGCVVVGWPGTGKTHAVAQAVNGAMWLDLREGEHQFDFFFTELAAQVPDGQGIVDALAARDADAVLRAADEAVGDKPLVIDRAERLQFDETWGWDDPVEALWRPEQARLARWIDDRLSSRPVVVIGRGRRDFLPDRERIHHVASPHQWQLKLRSAAHGFRDWPALGKALRGLPAGLWVGALLLELMSAAEWNRLVESLPVSSAEEGDRSLEALRELLRALRERMPDDWRRVLATTHELEGAPAEIIEGLLEADVATSHYLEELGALARRGDRLSVMPALLIDGPIALLYPAEREAALIGAAGRMLENVADLESPDASSAEWIVHAHSLYVEAGDFDAARRTARFHLGGLVRLARRTSLEKRWSEARRLYGIIEPLAADEPRMTSYIAHYRHMNGHWCGADPKAVVLAGLTRARALWPENALWWQREVELLLELGRGGDALRTLDQAYAAVADHPRRDLFLRVRPALHAMRVPGAAVEALRILEPLSIGALEEEPEARANWREILRLWARGVEVHEIGGSPPGRLVFHAPVALTLEGLDIDDYRAESRALERAARAATPLGALDKLALEVAKELRGLVETPSTRLSREELHRKGALIGLVDVLNSDIGLVHRTERWILGRFEGRAFVPVQSSLSPVQLGPDVALPRAGAATLYFGKFPVRRDGIPSGAPTGWELAGSGRGTEELWRRLREMSGRSDG